LASHPELPNCFGQGQTPEAAEQDLGDATELVLQHLADSGLSIPEPAYLRGEKPLILQMPGEPA
jgi:predicted RNase H-like HicB family nuclease